MAGSPSSAPARYFQASGFEALIRIAFLQASAVSQKLSASAASSMHFLYISSRVPA